MRSRHFKYMIWQVGLGLLAFGLAASAGAASVDPVVNTQIKQEFIHTQAQKLKADYEYAPPARQGLRNSQGNSVSPFKDTDAILDDQEPTTLGEQPGAMEMPQAGIARKIDPADPIEQEIEQKQAYDLYRANYRRAVQDEFMRRVHQAGYTTNRNLAAEIKDAEIKSGRSSAFSP